MRQFKLLTACCLSGLAACTSLVLAPGAEQVLVTKAPAEVAGCAPVGNLQVPKDTSGAIDAHRAVAYLKNQTVGLGGNAALVTDGSLRLPVAGVAYKCPSRSGAGS
jgi:hypothetical protein